MQSHCSLYHGNQAMLVDSITLTRLPQTWHIYEQAI